MSMKKEMQNIQRPALPKRNWGWVFTLLLLLCAACSDDNDNNKEIEQTKTVDKMLVTVVFAPGQLGDMGYADNVLDGIYKLKELGKQAKTDTLEINYITAEDIDATKEALDDFYYNTETRQGGMFKRRLLVLTEPFMLDWIEGEKKSFDERDEILILKMNKDDVTAAAQKMELGNRLHGLNISAASSAKRYCKYIEETIEDANAGIEEGDDDEDQVKLNCKDMVFFRLYEPDKVNYRDSIYEVLEKELGESTEITFWSMATTVGDGIFTDDGQTTILQEAFNCGRLMSEYYSESGTAFHVADLGSATAGLNYFFMSDAGSYLNLLSLDAEMTNKLWIRRDFGTAFYRWCVDWMRAKEGGSMPAVQEFGGWNSNYVTDNIMLSDDPIE